MSTRTKVFKVTPTNLSEVIRECAEIIQRGGTVAIPTETVYGLAANALDPIAVNRIFHAKGRPAGQSAYRACGICRAIRAIGVRDPSQGFIPYRDLLARTTDTYPQKDPYCSGYHHRAD